MQPARAHDSLNNVTPANEMGLKTADDYHYFVK